MKKQSDSEGENLQRGLSERHVQLIAIGGAVGIGLFLASGSAIASAGPSLLLSYLLGGCIVYFIMRALGEVAVENPITGSFSAYANKFISPCAGFMVGWTYWFLWVVSSMTEVTAVGIYCSFWWPELPQWIPGLLSLLCIMCANLFSIKMFGEIEFWFSLIKVVTIVLIVLVGLAMIFLGLGNGGKIIGLHNLYALKGGFFPFGISGVLRSLGMVILAFVGIEFIGVTAGEVRNPEKSIPSSINKVLGGMIFFYVGTMFVLMCIYPWMNITKGSGVSGSPFVATFSGLGIKQAAAIINFVVITAALSSCNSGMFSNGRMLYNLALQNHAPQFLGKLNSNKIPANGIIFSFFVSLIGVMLNYIMPDNVFMILAGISTALGIWIFGVIVVVQMKSRKNKTHEEISKLKYPMLFYPYSNYIAILALILTTYLLFVNKETRMSILSLVWLLFIYIVYKLFVQKNEYNHNK
ncbi:MAG: amino acid permease [Endomicrobium sp.]|jgi:AAT family amino acid transporter|nr:amino acid permease [Endomicrobium sp.]